MYPFGTVGCPELRLCPLTVETWPIGSFLSRSLPSATADPPARQNGRTSAAAVCSSGGPRQPDGLSGGVGAKAAGLMLEALRTLSCLGGRSGGRGGGQGRPSPPGLPTLSAPASPQQWEAQKCPRQRMHFSLEESRPRALLPAAPGWAAGAGCPPLSLLTGNLGSRCQMVL